MMKMNCGKVNHLVIWMLEDILNIPDDSDIGYFVEVDLKYPDTIKKTKNFPFAPENKKKVIPIILHHI